MDEPNALILEILKQEGALKMSVFGQSETASTVRHYSQCPVAFSEIERLCLEVAAILDRAHIEKSATADSLKNLTKKCQLLWSHLLTKAVKERLRGAPEQDLLLSIDEELINIPWELLYDGTNFLCLNFNLGRLVRTKEEPNITRYRERSSLLKMLILANPTNDLKSAYLEGVNIRNQFDRRRKNVLIDFKSTQIDKLYIKKNFCDYDIVHFAGHCEYDPHNPQASGWVLSDGRFGAPDILAIGSGNTLPALVFSNSCHSAQLADASDSRQDYREKNYTLASAFLFSGVRHYIGAGRRIEDKVSLSFAREFYTQLISGKSVGESIRLARLGLIKEYGILNLPWASYLLYGDPGFILFNRPALKKQAPKFKRNIAAYKKKAGILALAVSIMAICIYLYISLPTRNPSAYYLLLKSQKLFSQGQNNRVIILGQEAVKKDPLLLALYPLLADAYARLGDKQNALKYYFDYALFSEKRQDKNNLASAYIGIGWFYQLNGDFTKAIDFYNKALNVSGEAGDKLNEARALRKLAVWYIEKKDYAQALELLTKSAEINRSRQHSYQHRYSLACDYFDIGLVFSNKNDSIAAKEFYQRSRAIFEKMKLKNELSDCYFNLGEIYLFEKEYRKALDYYLSGLKIDLAQDNRMNLASDYNMLGEFYAEIDNYPQAEMYFNQAVAISRQINAQPELAGAYENLGLLYKKLGKISKAREYLRYAQEIYGRIDKQKYQEVREELLSLSSR